MKISKGGNFRRLLPFLVVIGFGMFGCVTKQEATKGIIEKLPFYEEATFTPKWFDQGAPADFHQIPPFSLTNQEGEVITERSLEGKIYVVDFFFTTCPGICSKMTTNMTIVQNAFLEDENVLLLSHSVTPDFDQVAILKDYAERRGVVSGKWHLLTGARAEIYDLGRNQYFVEEDLGLEKAADDFIHTENFVLVDENRNIRGIYNGLNITAVNQLISDMKTLLEEG